MSAGLLRLLRSFSNGFSRCGGGYRGGGAFAFMMKFHGVGAFLRGGNHFVMMFVFTLGEGGAAAKRESQCEEDDSNCSEFHFFTLSTVIHLFTTPSVTLPRYYSVRNGHTPPQGRHQNINSVFVLIYLIS